MDKTCRFIAQVFFHSYYYAALKGGSNCAIAIAPSPVSLRLLRKAALRNAAQLRNRDENYTY